MAKFNDPSPQSSADDPWPPDVNISPSFGKHSAEGPTHLIRTEVSITDEDVEKLKQKLKEAPRSPLFLSSEPLVMNRDGDFVPAVPNPYFRMFWPKYECRKHLGPLLGYTCGKKFWTMRGYKGHYAYVHILKMGKES